MLAATLAASCCTASAQASFEITPSAACAGMTVKVKNTTPGNCQIAKFAFGDGLEAYGNELQHIYATGGTYVVELTVLMDGGEWTLPKMQPITIGDKPEVTVSDNEKQGILTATVSEGASLKWYCNGQELKTTAASLYYKESGEYKAVATLSSGCKDSASAAVRCPFIVTKAPGYVFSSLTFHSLNCMSPYGCGSRAMLTVTFFEATFLLSFPTNNEEFFWTSSATALLMYALSKLLVTSGAKTALYVSLLQASPLSCSIALETIFFARASTSNLLKSFSKKISPPVLV